MKQMSITQMENLQGGAASASACKTMNTIAYVAGIGSLFGIVGFAICGPTALVLSTVSLVACN